MSTLYEARATVVGGREGHVRSDDGLLDLQLSMPKALGGKETGSNPEQMMEAVHVAAVMQAGITLVHSVQMQNHLKKLVL